MSEDTEEHLSGNVPRVFFMFCKVNALSSPMPTLMLLNGLILSILGIVSNLMGQLLILGISWLKWSYTTDTFGQIGVNV